MRLINTSTGALEEFTGRNIPEYAILSHTWEEEEVTFKEYTAGSYKTMKGYQKIESTCRLAREAGIRYAWVDTCCIDKSSSAELTECINSMYRWYGRSKICYVYLSDLPATALLEAGLAQCRWFTRGWTLQELIAPKNVDFYDQDWHHRGEKASLLQDLSSITGIRPAILDHKEPLSVVPVAERMSWASRRQTTRVEDTSYCLLGIFGVYMPMLYGEEENAFRRLQEEIIKNTSDITIFAWRFDTAAAGLKPPVDTSNRIFSSILASSPSVFRGYDLVYTSPMLVKEFRTSNQGVLLHSRLALERIKSKPFAFRRYILPICKSANGSGFGVRLRKLDTGMLVREDPYHIINIDRFRSLHCAPRHLCLLTELTPYSSSSPWHIDPLRYNALQLELPEQLELRDTKPWAKWDDESQSFFAPQGTYRSCIAAGFGGRLSQRDGKGGVITAQVTCMFYAIVEWFAEENDDLKFTIIDHRSFDAAVNQINTDISECDYQSGGWIKLLQNIDYYKIPKQSSVCFETNREGAKAVVSFAAERVTDPAICQRPLWRVVLRWKFCETKDVPSAKDLVMA
ncbi:heterokaryon incompatibility protein-domain-containing protein [Immersiella caudata]|uniref:Heterokaryon incompatibility protein-domain-containing protein n=1 Tax=Immersiella caudata TaxID=314043 RepID=A0AA39WDC2_9PEZI|nr:heterokaryon incompatibility protein-domain-containing protein [Immersiella caudata]